MSLQVFHVDAFTTEPFAGNPAAVCPLAGWLDDETLRLVAAENNLSETAFFVPRGDEYELRWFTPRCEVKLCGHATLASAFILMQVLGAQSDSLRFQTRFSGTLTVAGEGNLMAMDFPALPPWVCTNPPLELFKALGKTPTEVVQIEDNYFAVYDSQQDVKSIRPDFRILEHLHPAGVAITAKRDRFCLPLFRSQLRHSRRPRDRLDSLLTGALLGEATGQDELSCEASLRARRGTLVRSKRRSSHDQRKCSSHLAG